jgi:hypothetical protein
LLAFEREAPGLFATIAKKNDKSVNCCGGQIKAPQEQKGPFEIRIYGII